MKDLIKKKNLANKKVRLHSAQPLNVAKQVKIYWNFVFVFTNRRYPACITLFIEFRGLKQPRNPCMPSFAALTSVVLVWYKQYFILFCSIVLCFGPTEDEEK